MKSAIGNGSSALETRADKQGGTDREILTIMVGLSNAGKSELFERLTGEYSRPGNWAGTTNVDSDWRRMPNSRAVVMDTPGLDWGHIPGALPMVPKSAKPWDSSVYKLCLNIMALDTFLFNILRR